MKATRLRVEKARAKDVEQIRSVDKLAFQHARLPLSFVRFPRNSDTVPRKSF